MFTSEINPNKLVFTYCFLLYRSKVSREQKRAVMNRLIVFVLFWVGIPQFVSIYVKIYIYIYISETIEVLLGSRFKRIINLVSTRIIYIFSP